MSCCTSRHRTKQACSTRDRLPCSTQRCRLTTHGWHAQLQTWLMSEGLMGAKSIFTATSVGPNCPMSSSDSNLLQTTVKHGYHCHHQAWWWVFRLSCSTSGRQARPAGAILGSVLMSATFLVQGGILMLHMYFILLLHTGINRLLPSGSL